MSTDQSPDTEDRPGRTPRRRWLTTVGVAGAVLLAGGGGAYWAWAATSGSQDGADVNPPSLALDGQRASTDAGRGVAPGEPMGPDAYRTVNNLPDGPDAAAVHRPSHKPSEADVAKLAKSLRLKGDPQKKADRWEVAPKGEATRLSAQAGKSGGTWTFVNRDAVTGGCDLPVPQGTDDARHKDLPGTPAHTMCAQAPETKGEGEGEGAQESGSAKTGKAVSAAEAKDAVRPVLGALGLKDAALRAGSPVEGQRTVTVSPKVAGLATYGWDTTLTVDADGKLVRGAGNWGGTTKGASYPLGSAEETLNELTKERQKHGGATPESAHPDEPGAKSGKEKPQPPEKGKKQDPAEVTGAEFGLSLKHSHGDPVLVPSWMYDVKPSSGAALKIAHPAVDTEYLDSTGTTDGEDQGPGVGVPAPGGQPQESAPAQKPESPSPGGGSQGGGSQDGGSQGGGDVGAGGGGPAASSQAAESYKVEGRTLKISFWGGVCDTYKATADESDSTVKVRVKAEAKDDGKKVCVKIAKRQTAEVKLDKGLGGREVVDARDGDALPRK